MVVLLQSLIFSNFLSEKKNLWDTTIIQQNIFITTQVINFIKVDKTRYMYKYNCHIYGSVPHFFHIFMKTECLFNPWHISSIPMLKNHTLFTSSLKISVLFLIVQQKFSFYNCLEFSESKSENKRKIVESLRKTLFSTVLYYFLMKITKSLF